MLEIASHVGPQTLCASQSMAHDTFALANCSPRTLLRRFKAGTGLPPTRLPAAPAQRRRTARPRQLATHPEVAEQVGYADRVSFAKRCKQLCGEPRAPSADACIRRNGAGIGSAAGTKREP
ncbi:hypothetical protein I0E98_00980 [Pseudomonas lalucatii]|nr:hypothetical protein [Pseudomonas lalucatii]